MCIRDRVRQLLKDSGYPGMKVLEFAFGGDRKNPHLPHNYTQNCVVYGGTHDNETLVSWYQTITAATCIIPMQDWLGLDNSARINKPSTVGENWRWRLKKTQLTKRLQKEICRMTTRYGRMNWE